MKKSAVYLVIDIIVAISVFSLLYLFLRNTMFGASELGKEQTITVALFVPLAVIPLVYVFMVGRYPTISYGKPFIIFILLVYLLSLFHPLGSRLYLITIILPLIFFVFSYALDIRITGRLYLIFVMALLFLLSLYFYSSYSDYLIVEISFRTMGAYTLLYFLPFVLCLDKRLIRLCGIAAIFAALFMSLKRGGIVAFSFALLIFLTVKYIIESERKAYGVLIFATTIALAIYAFQYFDNQFDNLVTTRFLGIEDDEGSHRWDLYKQVWLMIRESSIGDTLFGHGWDSVLKNNPMRYSAHNELLEVLYDSGIFAFILFVAFLVSIIKFNIRLVKEKSVFAAPLAASLTLFIINSTISHTLLYTKYIIIFSLFWGFVLAERYKGKH